MPEQLESPIPDGEIQDVCGEITGTAEAAFDTLIERRDRQYADAIEPLNAEEKSLRQEYASIEEAAASLELLLPATAREAQREADRLAVAGQHAEARAKLAEAEQAANAPGAMRQRQQEIGVRLTAIEEERKTIARRIFETWYAECQAVVRAGETGLFITLLDSLKASFYEYQERTGTGGTLDRPFSFLVKDSLIQNLTAPDRSQEWVSGSRWYGGRVR
jgi:hypothetical protein